MSSHLPLLPQFAERFIQNFAEKRQPKASHQVVIDRRRLYILPTRHGVVFFIVLLLTLLGAINYENSLGFMLSFLLGSLGFLGMIYTHQNINHLEISIGRAESVFVNQEILYPVTIIQTRLESHPNIKLMSDDGKTVTTHLINTQSLELKLPVTQNKEVMCQLGALNYFQNIHWDFFTPGAGLISRADAWYTRSQTLIITHSLLLAIIPWDRLATINAGLMISRV